MERQLSLLEPLGTPGAVMLWGALDPPAQATVLRLLARLIAQAVLPTAQTPVQPEEEASDE